MRMLVINERGGRERERESEKESLQNLSQGQAKNKARGGLLVPQGVNGR